MAFNILVTNRDVEAIAGAVEAAQPDLIAFAEWVPGWMPHWRSDGRDVSVSDAAPPARRQFRQRHLQPLAVG